MMNSLKSRARLLLCIFILVISLNHVKAQGGFSWDRVVFGGNFGAGFSSNESLIALSPSVGYRFTERLTVGTGVIYQYYRLKIPGFDFKFNNYGGRLFTSYQLTDFLVAHAEYESLNLEYVKISPAGAVDGTGRRTINSTLVGGGYRQMLGRNSVVDILLLYNLTETPYTPYTNPIIRVNFGIGL